MKKDGRSDILNIFPWLWDVSFHRYEAVLPQYLLQLALILPHQIYFMIHTGEAALCFEPFSKAWPERRVWVGFTFQSGWQMLSFHRIADK